jgi:mannose-6-phosphate isomerase
MTPQPQLLPPNVIEHWYAGGPALAAWRGLPPVGERSPEEWIGATVARFGDPDHGPARLADGTLLLDAVRADPVGWLGRDDGDAGDTGVLVKLLDAGQRLPVHVHPTRDYASRHLGCAYGKTEAWYVLEAGPDAAVWVGWRDDVDQARVCELVDSQDAEAMLELMHRIPVRPGDGVLVPGGTPHAIGAGILLIEAQEPTDQSILLERTNTEASDAEVFLGLDRDTALSVVDTEALADPARLIRHARAAAAELVAVLPAEAEPFFRMELSTAAADVPAGFAVGVVLAGSGAVTSTNGTPLDVTVGQTLVIPAACGTWRVDGDAVLLVCRPGTTWPPNRPDSTEDNS